MHYSNLPQIWVVLEQIGKEEPVFIEAFDRYKEASACQAYHDKKPKSGFVFIASYTQTTNKRG